VYYEAKLELLPKCVREDICDIREGTLDKKHHVLRITLGRTLNELEKAALRTCESIIGVDNCCGFRYAPEIRHSYFYIKL
jgi:hypothetical protein